ncbi:MAG TPA: hypothetical protein VNA04_14215 [Thermoanaerobaculia bacterium]|nr:hypothetical protein [Thermoanaerobaculia bacterium]
MTARLRTALAIAILLALAAHPFAHPLLKECPCIHQTATGALDRADSFVLPLLAAPAETGVEHAVEAPEIRVRPSRAPPVG